MGRRSRFWVALDERLREGLLEGQTIVGEGKPALLDRFDIRFSNYSTAASYSGPAAIRLLRSGTEYFPALEAAIREARTEIHLETYIFAGDATGLRFVDALSGAAQRGVAVRVLIDGFGARDMSSRRTLGIAPPPMRSGMARRR
mgnify:CR=1 FL=1